MPVLARLRGLTAWQRWQTSGWGLGCPHYVPRPSDVPWVGLGELRRGATGLPLSFSHIKDGRDETNGVGSVGVESASRLLTILNMYTFFSHWAKPAFWGG